MCVNDSFFKEIVGCSLAVKNFQPRTAVSENDSTLAVL